MKYLLKLFIILGLFLFAQAQAYADNYKILVLPDNIQFETTNYYIYPDTSVMFANDIINEIKKDNRISIVSMAQIRETLRKNEKVAGVTARLLHEYKYNYNISFVDLRTVAKYFNCDTVMLITSQTDTQSYLLRRTLWDFLNIPGTTAVDSMYKLATYISLVNVKDEYVIWDKTYYKKVSSMEYRVIPNNFAPATEQLHKIKAYSKNNLAPLVASIVEAKILPEIRPVNGVMQNYNVVKSLRTNVLPTPVNYVSPKTTPKEEMDKYVVIKKDPEKVRANAEKKKAKAQAKVQKKAQKPKKSFKDTKMYKFFALPEEENIINNQIEDKIDIIEEIDFDFSQNTSGKQINKPNITPSHRQYGEYGVMMNAL